MPPAGYPAFLQYLQSVRVRKILTRSDPGNAWDQDDSYSSWCLGLPTIGYGPTYSAGPNDTVSGYEDVYMPGSGPAPCNQTKNVYYRGFAVFDLSPFDSIVAATLTFDVEHSISANGEVTSQIPPACNATTLGVATGTDYYNFDNPVTPLPPCGPSYTFDVSPQVRYWISNTSPASNYGFILAGPKLDFPNDLDQDNVVNLTWYTNFQLVVLYNPAQNPRAPQ